MRRSRGTRRTSIYPFTSSSIRRTGYSEVSSSSAGYPWQGLAGRIGGRSHSPPAAESLMISRSSLAIVSAYSVMLFTLVLILRFGYVTLSSIFYRSEIVDSPAVSSRTSSPHPQARLRKPCAASTSWPASFPPSLAPSSASSSSLSPNTGSRLPVASPSAGFF